MRIMGIDVGITGGIAVIDEIANVCFLSVMPAKKTEHGNEMVYENVNGLIAQADVLYVEKQGPIPQNGVKQAFNFGGQYHALRCMISLNAKRVTYVLPQRWKKAMLADMNKSKKESSIIRAEQLFPGVNLLRTPKCKNKHDGMAEALLIAEYGRRLETGV